MCKFNAAGRCKRGRDCTFAHTQSELRNKPDFSCTDMCPWLSTTGRCHDHGCRFAHHERELRPYIVQSAQSRLRLVHGPHARQSLPPAHPSQDCGNCARIRVALATTPLSPTNPVQRLLAVGKTGIVRKEILELANNVQSSSHLTYCSSRARSAQLDMAEEKATEPGRCHKDCDYSPRDFPDVCPECYPLMAGLRECGGASEHAMEGSSEEVLSTRLLVKNTFIHICVEHTEGMRRVRSESDILSAEDTAREDALKVDLFKGNDGKRNAGLERMLTESTNCDGDGQLESMDDLLDDSDEESDDSLHSSSDQ